ncbi:hypothetical protein ACTXT7_008547 [Hymenolepis weldensis]
MELSTATPIQAANVDNEIITILRDNAKVANLTHSMESSIPKVVPVRPFSEPIVSKQQQSKCAAKRDRKKVVVLLPPPDLRIVHHDQVPKISWKSFLLNLLLAQLEQYQKWLHKCRRSSGNGCTHFSPNPFICSQTKAPWSHIDFSLAEPIQGISYPSGFIFKVIKCHTSKICHKRQVSTANDISESVYRIIIQFSFAQFENFSRGLNIAILHFPPILNCLDEQLVDHVKRTPHIGVLIWTYVTSLRYEISNLWTPNAIIGQTVILDASEDLGEDSGLNRHPSSQFWMLIHLEPRKERNVNMVVYCGISLII